MPSASSLVRTKWSNLLESSVSKVEELLKDSEIYLGEMKFTIADLKKEATEARKEKIDSKSVTNDDKSSAITRSR